jgi:two-component system KDP operon response regulator KdpE
MLPHFPRCILAVDDEALILMLVEHTLSATGFEVNMASSGRDALEAASTRQPDLVVLNYNLGGPPEGVALLRQLRDLSGAPLPAIVITGYQLNAAERHALTDASGGLHVPVLTKPFEPEQLVAEIFGYYLGGMTGAEEG